MTKLQLGADKEVWRGQFISVLNQPFTNTVTGKSGNWEVVRRGVKGRIVGIMAVTPEMEVILIRIYRVPLKKYVIECVAGLPDHEGESEIELAKRELLEEVGYACDNITEVVSGPINGGLIADELVYFLGTGARKVADTTHETGEDIEVLKIPRAELELFLRNPLKDTIVDLKLWALIPFLNKLPSEA